MLNTIATVVAVVLGLHILAKFAFSRCHIGDGALCSTSNTATRLRLPPHPMSC
jgi:hypothetical protein